MLPLGCFLDSQPSLSVEDFNTSLGMVTCVNASTGNLVLRVGRESLRRGCGSQGSCLVVVFSLMIFLAILAFAFKGGGFFKFLVLQTLKPQKTQ